MSKWNITSSKVNKSFTLANDSLVVNGTFSLEEQSGELQAINGSCYRPNAQGEQGEFVGSFNGYARDGGIRYSLSEMSRRDGMAVLDAIDEIEQHIMGNE